MFKLTRKKVQSDKGMTMAEMLAVVAIMVILMGVAFVAIMTYMRSMAQLERDSIAKEILVAAQNHLTVAKGEGYPGIDENIFASDEGEDKEKADKAAGTEDPDQPGVYYIMVDNGEVQNKDGAGNTVGTYMWETMLPFGSVEEVVRNSGNYVICYQPNIGKVLDVFYCSPDHSEDPSYSGYDSRYGYSFKEEDYNNAGEFSLSGLRNKKDDTKEQKKEKKEKRREYKSDYVLGWHGGDGIDVLAHKIKAPKIKLHNGNILYVSTEYADEDDYNDASIRIIVEGKQSGAKSYFDTEKKNGSDNNEAENVVLDDITSATTHFDTLVEKNRYKDNDAPKFIPGEDIKVRAIAYCKDKIANIAESNIKEGNSLFKSIADEDKDNAAGSDLDDKYTLNGETVTIENSSDEVYDTAYIANFRHLENLDKFVSNLDANDGKGNDKKLLLKKAIQTEDLDWTEYFDNKSVFYSGSETYSPTSPTNVGCYKPVSMPNENAKGFTYNGRINKETHEISGVKTNVESSSNAVFSAGLFYGVRNSKIKNLKLKNFDMNSTKGSAGALADTTSGNTEVNNITATNIKVDSNSNAGLIGTATNTKMEKLHLVDFEVISSTASAGTVAGSMNGGSVSNAVSYNSTNTPALSVLAPVPDPNWPNLSGTANGENKAGGLIGEMTGGTLEFCAASVRVFGEDAAGGLVGNAMDGTVINGCYSGGHTEDGQYDKWIDAGNGCDVNGQSAGGLVGPTSGSLIENSYSTCSVYGIGEAGGFAGESNGTIKNCYSTGLVKSENDEKLNAFLGGNKALSSDSTNNMYYSTVNEDQELSDDYADAFDTETGNLKQFTADTSDAEPYDNYIKEKYGEGYMLRSVTDLLNSDTDFSLPSNYDEYFINTHYGDWPSPEVVLINDK